MITYQVWMKGMGRFLEVQADEVNLESVGGVIQKAFWNFTATLPDAGADAVTLHAFPFETVEYIVSVVHLTGGAEQVVAERKSEDQASQAREFSHPSGFGVVAGR